MCKLMGWAMSSDMPDRYIDRQGVVEDETLKAIRGDALKQTEVLNTELKRQLTELQHNYSQIMEQLERKRATDDFMERLVADEELQRLLCQKISEMGLQGQLICLGADSANVFRLFRQARLAINREKGDVFSTTKLISGWRRIGFGDV